MVGMQGHLNLNSSFPYFPLSVLKRDTRERGNLVTSHGVSSNLMRAKIIDTKNRYINIPKRRISPLSDFGVRTEHIVLVERLADPVVIHHCSVPSRIVGGRDAREAICPIRILSRRTTKQKYGVGSDL